MNAKSQIIIYMTCANEVEAQNISQVLIEKKLVACANIMSAHKSLYWWEGEIQSAEEVVVIYKTRSELFENVTKEIKSLHSYDVPCIVSLKIECGYEPFLSWIEEETFDAVS